MVWYVPGNYSSPFRLADRLRPRQVQCSCIVLFPHSSRDFGTSLPSAGGVVACVTDPMPHGGTPAPVAFLTSRR
jgi:hypothetical protein